MRVRVSSDLTVILDPEPASQAAGSLSMSRPIGAAIALSKGRG